MRATHRYSTVFLGFGFVVFTLVAVVGCDRQQEDTYTSASFAKEQESLPTPKGATHVGTCSYTAKSLPATKFYGCEYRSRLSFEDLLNFYSGPLQDRGWHEMNETSVLDWGRDQGGKQVYFCKNNLKLTLFYFGKESSSPERYTLEISVGIPPVCEPSPLATMASHWLKAQPDNSIKPRWLRPAAHFWCNAPHQGAFR